MSFVKFRNKDIYYRMEGSGNPVMLLHGFGEDSSIWNQQVEKLKKKFLVIIPDLPGSGQSGIIEGACLLEDYAEAIKLIIEEESITSKSYGTISLIGHSLGGYIALAFAKKYSQLLNSLGLFHSSAFADDEDKIITRQKAIEFIGKNGSQLYAQQTVPNLFSDFTKKENPQLIKNLIDITGYVPAKTLIQYTRAMIEREDTIVILKSFPKPVLFIIGINDNAVPLNTSLKQCHLTQIGSVHFLQKSGHIGMWEEPELSSEYLFNFLNYFVYPNK